MKLLLLVLNLGFMLPVHATEAERTRVDTNRDVVRTYARVYLESETFEKADALLTDYLTRDADDGNLWVLLGQVQLAERKLSQACYAFQKAGTLIRDAPNRMFAEYNFADCLNRGGRTAEAKAILTRLSVEEGESTRASAHALELMEAGAIRPGNALPYYQSETHGKWRLTAAMGTGFDSNVLLVNENVINNTAASEHASFFATPALQAGYVGRAFGDAFDSRYLLSYTDYLSQAAKTFNSVYQRVDFSFGSGPIRWGVFGDTLFLNRNPMQLYNWDAGISYLLIRQVGGDFALTYEIPLRYQKFTLDSNTSADNDRSGADLQLRANARWIQSATEQFNQFVVLDAQYTEGKNYRLLAMDLPGVWMTSLPLFRSLGLMNTFSGEVQGQYYFQSDTQRKDLLLRASAGLVKAIAASFSLNGELSYLKNFSTVETARYHKFLVTLQLSHDFL